MITSNIEVLIILSENGEGKSKDLHLYSVTHMLLGVKKQVQDRVIMPEYISVSGFQDGLTF